MKGKARSMLHRPVDVRSLPAKGWAETVEPTDDERAALMRANGLLALPSFRAPLRVGAWGPDGVRVTGTVEARVVQECVVSLDPVEGTVSEPVDVTLVPEGSPLARTEEAELMLDAEGDDPPETFEPPYVDIGAIAAEHLALGLDPYPRAPDARLPDEASDPAANPFAALARGLKSQS